MDNMRVEKIFLVAVFFLVSPVFGQNVLTDDTLFFGSASGFPGDQVVVPVYIKTTVVYQGWQIPVKFGNGNSPLYCDSVSLAHSCMMSIPHEWDFIAPFVNNHQWDNMQTCGVAGVVDMAPPYEWLEPGDYMVMELYVTIDTNAQPQAVLLDTATSAWYSGGPQNAYAISHNSQSYQTVVRAGFLEILASGIAEKENEDESGSLTQGFALSPSLVNRGQVLTLEFTIANKSNDMTGISIIDVSGRVCQSFKRDVQGRDVIKVSTTGLTKGAYFVVVTGRHGSEAAKFIIE